MEYGILWLGALLVFIDLAYPIISAILLGKEMNRYGRSNTLWYATLIGFLLVFISLTYVSLHGKVSFYDYKVVNQTLVDNSTIAVEKVESILVDNPYAPILVMLTMVVLGTVFVILLFQLVVFRLMREARLRRLYIERG